MKLYDAIIIGGGPGGAIAGLLLARRGMSVLRVDMVQHPRFHVGESFMPRVWNLMQELGLGEPMERVTYVPKFGAEFAFGHGDTSTLFEFSDCLYEENTRTFNVERAPYDNMLLTQAKLAGAEVRSPATVRRIVKLEDRDVAVIVDDQEVRGRILLDASGQSTIVARHRGTRKPIPGHRKVAYFNHFHNCYRLPGLQVGHPTVAMCDEGWFWMINIDETRTSIGVVLDADIAKTIPCSSDQMLFWAIERCPLLAQRTANAIFPERVNTAADFSYYCKPFAGPGHFLVGDAAFFLDPIFSTGACLAMVGAQKAAELTLEMLTGRCENGKPGRSPERIRREYCQFVATTSSPFLRMVRLFYHHSFRELFLHGHGPFKVRNAAISILAGYVFPKPPWGLRWRLWMLEQMTRVNRHFALVPRRERFSLLAGAAVESPQVVTAA
jgi:flavin-dependent dehydrogenase